MTSHRVQAITDKKLKHVEKNMNWSRVEELLAEKLADRVKINLKIRESEEELDEEDGVEEMDFSPDEVNEEIDARELAFFFINRHFNKIHKVG